jgi:hypothetical protein
MYLQADKPLFLLLDYGGVLRRSPPTVFNKNLSIVAKVSLVSTVDAVGRDFQLFVGTCGKGNPPQGVPVTMGGPTFRSRNLRVVS